MDPFRERNEIVEVRHDLLSRRDLVAYPVDGVRLVFSVRVCAGDGEDGFSARELAGAGWVAVVQFDTQDLRHAMADLSPRVCHGVGNGSRAR